MSTGSPHKAYTTKLPPEVRALLNDPLVAFRLQMPVTLDRNFCIPYLAGYSTDGRTIYIDKHLPVVMPYHEHEIPIDKYLQCHEHTEKSLMDGLAMSYQEAHKIATLCEHLLVAGDGILIGHYEDWLRPYIHGAEREKLDRLPANLDLRPYEESQDYPLVKRILAEQRKQ